MMAEPCTVRDLAARIGQTVTIRGWLTHYRSSGRIRFLVLRDGTGVVQTVVKAEAAELAGVESWEQIGQESSLIVTGQVHRDARAPVGVEVEVRAVQVLAATHEYPITPKEHGVDFLMDHRHLWIRSPRQAAILRLRSIIVQAIRGFLDSHGFVVADPPIITPTPAEGSTTLFAIDYFGEPAYLSQSGQLYMEALALALGRVYSFGPTFRAEKSKTRRHLTEFWMIEPEMAFCEFEENLVWQEQLVEHIAQQVLLRALGELNALQRPLAPLENIRTPFPRITYDEALVRLAQLGMPIAWGEDLGAPHETALANQFDCPVFVTHFPTHLKAFYMQPEPTRPEVVRAAALLAPEGYGEIIGGSQRIHDLSLLESRMAEHGLDASSYAWYLDLRRYGTVPHSGFGLGLERLVAWFGGLDHVRETTPFARTLNRVWP